MRKKKGLLIGSLCLFTGLVLAGAIGYVELNAFGHRQIESSIAEIETSNGESSQVQAYLKSIQEKVQASRDPLTVGAYLYFKTRAGFSGLESDTELKDKRSAAIFLTQLFSEAKAAMAQLSAKQGNSDADRIREQTAALMARMSEFQKVHGLNMSEIDAVAKLNGPEPVSPFKSIVDGLSKDQQKKKK